ncbi:sugar phosphate isomerase/epimerase family protein [Paramicrobacterium fandaimingii]|uniref:sugar phosphate isomerase/epimerase family protein n=1 Tax=Paramicrobacterium fandaimingii TaxID=2708079 RepID=UPI001423B7AD|nr:TIM barrel protein [Microbacterium fandaimingii]
MTLGINTCFAVKRWTRPDDILRIVGEELGLQVCQLSVDNVPLADPRSAESREYVRRFAATCDTAGVELDSIFTGLAAYSTSLLLDDDEDARNAAEAWYESLIVLGGIAGVRSVGGHIGALSVPTASDPARRERAMDELRDRMLRLSQRAENEGLATLLFENMAVSREPGSVRENALALEGSLATASVPWQLCFDVGHPVAMASRDDDDALAPWFETRWKTNPMLQLQYSRPDADMHAGFDETDPAVGVNPTRVAAALAEGEWPNSSLFIEVMPAHEMRDDAVVPMLRRTVDVWTEVLA